MTKRSPRKSTLFALICFAVTVLMGSPAKAAGTTASISVPTSLTGSPAVGFSASVLNVSASNVVLRLQGTTTNVSTSLTCLNGASQSVSCAVGAVRKVVLKPAKSLTPGQRYTVWVNPSDAGSPARSASDLSAVPMTSRTFIASLYEQETSVAATYKWRTFKTSLAYGGSYQADYLAGSRFSFGFVGSSLTWYTRTGPGQGLAAVSISGKSKPTVNNYSSKDHYRVARTYSGLGSGYHYITVRVLGQKGSTSGTGTWVAVDGFAVNASLVSGAPTRFAWQTIPAKPASGDRYVRAGTPGASVAFVFRGRSIDWITVKGPRQGSATMYIDGVKKASVTNHATAPQYGVIRRLSNLSDTVHTLSIVSGTGFSSIDRFIVRLPNVAIFRHLGAWVDLWDYGTSSGLTASSAVAAMHSRGVRTIYIETARYNSSSAFDFPTHIGQWIEAAHANGMKIIGWYLPTYSTYLDKDVGRTVAIATFRSPAGQGFDGLAIDIEHKLSSQSRTAWMADIATHLARVRYKATAAFPIGAIIPAPLAMKIYPSGWTGFPWASIGKYANVVLPMGYWSYRTDCSTDPTHCAYGYSAGNIKEARSKTGLPVHVIGGVANDVSSKEVSDFIRAAHDAKAYGASLYDYRTTVSTFWAALAGANSL